MRLFKLLILAAALWPAGLSTCFAQAGAEDEQNRSDFGLEVPLLRILVIEQTSLDFDMSEEQVLAGMSDVKATNAHVSSNQPWVLRIYGTSPTWIGPSPKPVSDIEFSADGGAFRPLTENPAVLRSGQAIRDLIVPLEFQVRVNIERDAPGTYTYDSILYELGTP
jgi:hypothetical protein